MKRVILLCSGLCCISVQGVVWAADKVLPPPTQVEQSAHAREVIEDQRPVTSPPSSVVTEDVVGDLRVQQKKDGTVITEYRSQGHVYMIKVQPPGELPAYYIYDGDGDGVFEKRLPGDYKSISPPLWTVRRF